jgi:type I restriction enzyme S subunit
MKGMVSKSRFEEIRLIFPPLPLQKEFAQRVEAVEKLKATHRASLSELQALFASLQHRAFRGEL